MEKNSEETIVVDDHTQIQSLSQVGFQLVETIPAQVLRQDNGGYTQNVNGCNVFHSHPPVAVLRPLFVLKRSTNNHIKALHEKHVKALEERDEHKNKAKALSDDIRQLKVANEQLTEHNASMLKKIEAAEERFQRLLEVKQTMEEHLGKVREAIGTQRFNEIVPKFDVKLEGVDTGSRIAARGDDLIPMSQRLTFKAKQQP